MMMNEATQSLSVSLGMHAGRFPSLWAESVSPVSLRIAGHLFFMVAGNGSVSWAAVTASGGHGPQTKQKVGAPLCLGPAGPEERCVRRAALREAQVTFVKMSLLVNSETSTPLLEI